METTEIKVPGEAPNLSDTVEKVKKDSAHEAEKTYEESDGVTSMKTTANTNAENTVKTLNTEINGWTNLSTQAESQAKTDIEAIDNHLSAENTRYDDAAKKANDAIVAAANKMMNDRGEADRNKETYLGEAQTTYDSNAMAIASEKTTTDTRLTDASTAKQTEIASTKSTSQNTNKSNFESAESSAASTKTTNINTLDSKWVETNNATATKFEKDTGDAQEELSTENSSAETEKNSSDSAATTTYNNNTKSINDERNSLLDGYHQALETKTGELDSAHTTKTEEIDDNYQKSFDDEKTRHDEATADEATRAETQENSTSSAHDKDTEDSKNKYDETMADHNTAIETLKKANNKELSTIPDVFDTSKPGARTLISKETTIDLINRSTDKLEDAIEEVQKNSIDRDNQLQVELDSAEFKEQQDVDSLTHKINSEVENIKNEFELHKMESIKALQSAIEDEQYTRQTEHAALEKSHKDDIANEKADRSLVDEEIIKGYSDADAAEREARRKAIANAKHDINTKIATEVSTLSDTIAAVNHDLDTRVETEIHDRTLAMATETQRVDDEFAEVRAGYTAADDDLNLKLSKKIAEEKELLKKEDNEIRRLIENNDIEYINRIDYINTQHAYDSTRLTNEILEARANLSKADEAIKADLKKTRTELSKDIYVLRDDFKSNDNEVRKDAILGDSKLWDALAQEVADRKDDDNELKADIAEVEKKAQENLRNAIRDVITDGDAQLNEAYDTLQEVSEWLGNNTSNAEEIISTINSLQRDIDGMNLEQVGGDGNYIKYVSQEDGQLSAQTQSFATAIGATGDDNNAPTTKAVRDAINTLDYEQQGSDGSYIKTIKEENGIISVELQQFDSEVSDSGTDNNTPTTKAVYTSVKAVQDAVDALNLNQQGEAGLYIRAVSQNKGQLSATAIQFDTSLTESGTDDNVPTTKTVYTAISHEENRATTAEGSLSEAISNEATRASTAESDLSTAISNEETARKDAIEALDADSPTADGNETSFIDTISQADGLITATKKTIPYATENAAGIVMLVNSVDSTDEDKAVSAKAVNVVYEALNDEITNRENAVSAEASARDTAISSAIATEETNRNDAISAAITNLSSTSQASSGNYIAAISQTNGIVSILAEGTIPTTLPASDTVHTYSSASTAPISGQGVNAAIGTLSMTATGAAASKTVTALSETNGVISATFSNIQIGTDQVTGLNDALNGKQSSGSYKTTQDAVKSPTASGNTTSFIDTISQNSDGVITATKKTVSTATDNAAGLMSAKHKKKLDGIDDGANNYSHPTGDGNGHVPITGTTHNGQFLRAGAKANTYSWGTLTKSDITTALGYTPPRSDTDTTNASSLTCTSAKYCGSSNTTNVQTALNNLAAAVTALRAMLSYDSATGILNVNV